MKKHLNKILVFFLNLLLMAVAVFVIESKDQEKRAINAKNSLQEENDSLKYELNTLKGALRDFESQSEKAVEPIIQDVKTDSAANVAPINQPAANSTANTSSSNSSSSQNSPLSPNAKTKTS